MSMGRKKKKLYSVWFIFILPLILACSFREPVKNIFAFSCQRFHQLRNETKDKWRSECQLNYWEDMEEHALDL